MRYVSWQQLEEAALAIAPARYSKPKKKNGETSINDVLMLPGFLTQNVVSPSVVYHGVSMVVIDSIQGPGLAANDSERWQALFQATALTRSNSRRSRSAL